MFRKIRIIIALVGIVQPSIHTMETPSNITIIGLGLIGGSMAKDLKQKDPATIITACDTNTDSLEFALRNKLIDKAELNIPTAIQGANIIIIGVPINHFESVLTEIKSDLTENQIITDVCSVKGPIVEIAKQILKKNINQFVPGHPMAGSEKTGVENSVSDLFNSRKTILTPIEQPNAQAFQAVKQLWEKLGAIVKTMTPQEHDSTVAAISHMPHVVAFALKDMFEREDHKEMRTCAGSGFESMIRIANSPKPFWDNIFKANKDAVLREIELFKKQLDIETKKIIDMES